MSAEEIKSVLELFGVDIPLAYIVLGSILCIIIVYIYKLINNWIKNVKWRRRYISEVLREYGEYHTKQANRLYIETCCQNIPPSDFIDPSESHNVVVAKSLLEFYLNNVLVNPNSSDRLYCILGGSGMGKSTFICQLIRKYVAKYRKESRLPYHIELFCLGSNDVLSKIEMVQDKHNKVLILDGLDENVDALNDYDAFKVKLEALIQDFRIVIVTCRTQFFEDEDSEIRESRLINTGVNKGFRTYNKLYISPFTPEQISKYISKLFPYNRKRRRQCHQLLQECSALFVRPLMMRYLNDLISTNNNYRSVSDIYELLIRAWIRRDVANFNTDQDYESELYDFSQKLAVYIYNHRFENNGLFMNKDEFEPFLRDNNFSASPNLYRIKSLINRNSNGQIKFAHKSFLEYFLALESFNNSDFKCQLEGLEMFNKFYSEFCANEMVEYTTREVFECRTLETFRSGPVRILFVNAKSDYNYNHLQYSPDLLVINWEAYNDSLRGWMISNECESVLIHKYKSLRFSLNPVLSIPQLKQCLVVNSIPPSNTFAKTASKNNIKLEYIKEIKLEDAVNKFCIIPSLLREQAKLFSVNHLGL